VHRVACCRLQRYALQLRLRSRAHILHTLHPRPHTHAPTHVRVGLHTPTHPNDTPHLLSRYSGCGFVTFTSADAASKAIELNGQDFGGRPIKCELSQGRANSPQKGGGKKFEAREQSQMEAGCTTVFMGEWFASHFIPCYMWHTCARMMLPRRCGCMHCLCSSQCCLVVADACIACVHLNVLAGVFCSLYISFSFSFCSLFISFFFSLFCVTLGARLNFTPPRPALLCCC
jgi:hypothetical protein